MQEILQSRKANCTREEARALLEELRLAYQRLAVDERKQIRNAFESLRRVRTANHRQLHGTELAMGAR